jgi:hypothetical protein
VIFLLAAVSPFVPAPLYPLYCLALRAWARRGLELAGEEAGVPIHVLPGGGIHDAIGIGWASFGLVLASRAALCDSAWPGMRAHLVSHVRCADGWCASAIITTTAIGALWQSVAVGVAGLLALALCLRVAERRADRAAADALQGNADTVAAFARYTAEDGGAVRGAAFQEALSLLRRLGLASHPRPERRRANFLMAARGARARASSTDPRPARSSATRRSPRLRPRP